MYDIDPMQNQLDIPVLLVRTGEREVTAVTGTASKQGWARIGASFLGALAPVLGIDTENCATARTFQMSKGDEALWDQFTKYGRDGYAFGTLVDGRDGKFVRNVGFKEIDAESVRQARGIDPLALSSAMAMASIQAAVDRVEALVKDVQWTVSELLHFVWQEQESEVLTAVELVEERYATYSSMGTVGSVDWSVLAPLGATLKRQHRQLIAELARVRSILAFGTIAEADAATRLDPSRVEHLMTLECFLLRALGRWSEMELAVKSTRNEAIGGSAGRARTAYRDRYLEPAREAICGLRNIHTIPRGRSWHQQLLSDGWVRGHQKDERIRHRAEAIRHEVGRKARICKKLPAAEATPKLRLVGCSPCDFNDSAA